MDLLQKLHTFHKSLKMRPYVSSSAPKVVKKLKLRVKEVKDSDGIAGFEHKNLSLSKDNICLPYEAMIPLTCLTAHAQKFFLFLLAYYVNKSDHMFKWVPHVKEAYAKFYQDISGISVKLTTVEQAFKQLCKSNVVQRVEHTTYVVNPLYLPRVDDSLKTINTFKSYTEKAIKKKNNALDALEFRDPQHSKRSTRKA